MFTAFSSKSGSSESYAVALASRLGCPSFPIDSMPEDGRFVFFGWIRGKRIVGLDRVDRSRVVAVCVVGLDDQHHFESLKREIADRNSVTVPMYYMRGWIDRSKLNPLDKGVLLAVAVMMKLRGLNEFNKPIFDAMMEGGSFYDESQLDSVERFLSTSK